MDADVFSRIISNLVDNSLQALDKDQGLISISCTFSGDNFVISVEDNGKGISADLVSKLWAKGASFGKSSGTGLGLYHARSNIESWGGHCLLKSVEGKGTRVEVRLKTSS